MQRKSYIYFVRRADGLIKIGRSQQPLKRISTLRTEYGELDILGYIRESIGLNENTLHKHFSIIRFRGEWFEPSQPLLRFIAEYGAREPELALPDSYVELPVRRH